MTPLPGIALDRPFLYAKHTVSRSEEAMVAQKLKEKATKIIEATLSRENPSMFQRSLGYLQSFHKRANAKTRAAKDQIHVEPIVFNLPYDVMESIWSQISLIDRLQCTRVCKVWRTQLLDSAVMWGDVSECNVRDLKPYNINGKDIRQVNLERDPEAIEFLLALKCSNIQSITVNRACFRNAIELEPFQELLRFTGPALRYLLIMIVDMAFEDILWLIFSECSSLTNLRLFITKNSGPPISSTCTIVADSPVATSMKQVVDLDLFLGDINQHAFRRLLPYFTGLRDISITSTFYPNHGLLSWLDETIPAWQTIQLGERPFAEKRHIEYGKQGYKALSYGVRWVNDEDLQHMLEKYGSIMTAIHIKELFGSRQRCSIIQNYLNIGTPHLRSLVLISSGGSARGFDIDEILGRLPCLEQLILWNINFREATEKTDTPLEQQNRSLKIVKLIFCYGLAAHKLHKLVDRFHPSMERIWFNSLDELPNQVLDSIADRVSSLDWLFLLQKDLTNEMVQRLANKWMGKRLNNLRIRGSGHIKSYDQLQNYVRHRLPNTDVVIDGVL